MAKLPPLSAVRAFEAAARHGSFTKAAAELGMTQAAVSYQVKLLEDRVRAPLFLRQARRVVLSEAGQRLAPPVSEAFQRLETAFAGLRETNERVLSVTAIQASPPTGWCRGSVPSRWRIPTSPCGWTPRAGLSTSRAKTSTSAFVSASAVGQA